MVDELLTVDQVAEKLCVTNQTVWKYIKSGRLPAKFFGKFYRIKQTDLDAFIENPSVE